MNALRGTGRVNTAAFGIRGKNYLVCGFTQDSVNHLPFPLKLCKLGSPWFLLAEDSARVGRSVWCSHCFLLRAVLTSASQSLLQSWGRRFNSSLPLCGSLPLSAF